MQVRIQMRPGWMTRVAIFCGSFLGGLSKIYNKQAHQDQDSDTEFPSFEEELARAREVFKTMSNNEKSKFFGLDFDTFRLGDDLCAAPYFRQMLLGMDIKRHRFGRLEHDLKRGRLELYGLQKLGVQTLTQLLEVVNCQTERQPLPDFVTVSEDASSLRCSECGEHVEIETNGVEMRVKSECLCPPEGPIEFELNVPSGRIVVANDLRDLFDVPGDFEIGCRLGIIKQTLAMARIGCAYGFVGNSCPGVYRVDENTLAIASVPTDDDTDEPINPPGERVGGICTDLWWYSIVDADEYVRRGGKEEDRVDRLAVRPGVYKFSHNLRRDDRYGETFIFATIIWVREPDPVKDYLKEYREANFTAGQVIANQVKRWPSLYGGPDGIMDAANQIFCVIGAGGNWHPNGFVQFDPDMASNDPDVEIPAFAKPFHWYPLSKSSAIVVAAGLGDYGEKGRIRLNPSFVALARNVLECMIAHGSIPPNVPGWKEKGDPNLDWAQKCLEKINQYYPAA